MDFPIVVKLNYPIVHGTETITELKIHRRAQVKDYRGTGDMTDLDRSFKLIERLTAQPPSVIDDLDETDYQRIGGIVESFLSGSPGDGKKQ